MMKQFPIFILIQQHVHMNGFTTNCWEESSLRMKLQSHVNYLIFKKINWNGKSIDDITLDKKRLSCDTLSIDTDFNRLTKISIIFSTVMVVNSDETCHQESVDALMQKVFVPVAYAFKTIHIPVNRNEKLSSKNHVIKVTSKVYRFLFESSFSYYYTNSFLWSMTLFFFHTFELKMHHQTSSHLPQLPRENY
jgi:hypothetical protein